MTSAETPLATALDAIEAELDRLYPGLPEPTPEEIAEGGAFGVETMVFPQWLRFVFAPIARLRLAGGDLPASSAVGAQAVREFDGDDEAAQLVDLLAEFDALINAG